MRSLPRLITVITSDRGLCGGYNANLIRQAEEQADEMRKEGIEPAFFAVGRKAVDHFKRTGAKLAGQQINNTPAPGNDGAGQLDRGDDAD